jgi:ketosteroid isomerase-like protein
MIERAWAEAFAREWVADWNAHDLERILAHYADDLEMTSPLIIERMGIPSGKLKGKEAVGSYWAEGLAATPQLHFELLEVMVGVNSLAIVYKSATLARIVMERIEFDEQRRGARAEALHGAPAGSVKYG